jgi:small nuclear ribonucleoprotein (snRNP)-like protein
MKIKKAVFLILFVLSASALYSQTAADTATATQKVIVKMKNGDEFRGVIVKKDEQTVTLKTENGELNLIASNVKSIENDTNTGKFRFTNPHDTRYFFGPSGIPIRKRKGYYQNVLLTTNFVNYGITRNVSIGGGFEFISTVLGNPIWFLTPKVGFDISKNVHAAGGVILAGFALEGTASLGYGVFTLGGSEHNLTVGGGYGFMSGEFSKYPAIMICGTTRPANSIALLTENYAIPDNSGDYSYFGIHGIRILSPKNSFDIGAIVSPIFSGFIPALPFVGYARSFKRNKKKGEKNKKD